MLLPTRVEEKMDALKLLKRDHDAIKQLFRQFESSKHNPDEIIETLSNELEGHSHIEESIFYPIVEEQQRPELIAMVAESLDEHQEVKGLLKEIRGTTREAAQLAAKVLQLKRKVEYHVAEEENNRFPRVRQAINDDELNRIGAELEFAKQTYSADPPPSSGAAVNRSATNRTLASIAESLHKQRRALIQRQSTDEQSAEQMTETLSPEREERAQEEQSADILDSLSEREQEEIRQIDSALARIEAGTYGRCENCGRPIEDERLCTTPTTLLCANCSVT
jgi:RNA polymerase-binding transcription factor DksA